MDRSCFAMVMWGASPTFMPIFEGSEGELLRIGGAAGPANLYHLTGGVKESVFLVQAGDFIVRFVKRPGSSLTMLTCEVGSFQWLLAHDSPVLRVGPKKFTFGMPGFFYALDLPEDCIDEDVRRLEIFLVMSSTYVNHAGVGDHAFCGTTPETDFWASAYTTIRRLSLSHPSILSARGPAESQANTQWSMEQAVSMLWRAMRTSAATKLLGKILPGPINPATHIEIDVGPIAAGGGGWPYIFPSMRAVSDIVDAVESTKGMAEGAWSMAPECWTIPPDGTMYWHLNLDGLMLIARCLMAIAERNRANQRRANRAGGGAAAAAAEGSSSGLFSGRSGNANVPENMNDEAAFDEAP